MKLDFGSWSIRLNVKGGNATPSWGTALGQGKGYLYSFPDKEKYCKAMDNKKVSNDVVDCPMGKGGKQVDKYKKVRAAVFDEIFLHYGNGNPCQLTEQKLILIELEQLIGVHTGRKTLKYNINNAYDGITNEKCFDSIESNLHITKNDGWFVREINFENDNELHLYVYVIRGKTKFENIESRKKTMVDALNIGNNHEADQDEFVSHYTSLESAISIMDSIEDGDIKFRATRFDCLNDPNECRYLENALSDVQPAVNSAKPYILSFCKKLDNPIMWRLYKSKIQFVFDKESIISSIEENINSEKVSLESGDVQYVNCSNKEEIKEELESEFGYPIDENNINSVQSIVKHTDYDVECEWRIFATETKEYDNNDRNNDLENKIIGVGTAFGLVKFFRIIPIPIKALKEIVIYEFDSNKFELIKSQLKYLLNIKSIDNIMINQTQCVGFRN